MVVWLTGCQMTFLRTDANYFGFSPILRPFFSNGGDLKGGGFHLSGFMPNDSLFSAGILICVAVRRW